MKDEELLKASKTHIRKMSNDALDAEVERLQNFAIADLERIGVEKSWLTPPIEDPLIQEAIIDYVKAKYTITDQYDILMGCYNMSLTKIKGASKYKLPKVVS